MWEIPKKQTARQTARSSPSRKFRRKTVDSPDSEDSRRAHPLENLRAPDIEFSPEEIAGINARLSQMLPAGERYAPGSVAARSVHKLIWKR